MGEVTEGDAVSLVEGGEGVEEVEGVRGGRERKTCSGKVGRLSPSR